MGCSSLSDVEGSGTFTAAFAKRPDGWGGTPNCESGNSCQNRISHCIDCLAAAHPGRSILLSTHGNAIGLFLNLLDDSFGFEEWADIKIPDLFRITYQDGVRTWDKSFTYP